MHLFFDSTAEFTDICCRHLQDACVNGVFEQRTRYGDHPYDPYCERWVKALDVWNSPEEVCAALDAEAGHILSIGRAHNALLADVAVALLQDLYGDALLARIQSHFPGIELTTRLPGVRQGRATYKAADKRYMDWLIDDLGLPNEARRNRKPLQEPTEPPHTLIPTDPAETRAQALLYQLLPLLPEQAPVTPPATGLCYWHFIKQPDPLARYIDNYTRFDVPKDLDCAPLVRIQQAVCDRALDTKLAVLRATLCGIVTRRFEATASTLAAHFDGDMPALERVRFLPDPKTGNPAAVLRLEQALAGDAWLIACSNETATLDEVACQALQQALDNLLSETEAQRAQLTKDFMAALAALEAFDDRRFQGWLREMQASALVVMLCGLPTEDRLTMIEKHPFHDKVERNMSRRAWEMIEIDCAQRGNAPLDAFEMSDLLGVLLTITPDLLGKSLFSKRSRYPLPLPDIEVCPGIRLVERQPRQCTLAIHDAQWIVNSEELHLLLNQLRHRTLLRQGDHENFARAWVSNFLKRIRRDGNDGSWRRFLRPLGRDDARLLNGTHAQDGRWTEIARIVLAHPVFADYTSYA